MPFLKHSHKKRELYNCFDQIMILLKKKVWSYWKQSLLQRLLNDIWDKGIVAIKSSFKCCSLCVWIICKIDSNINLFRFNYLVYTINQPTARQSLQVGRNKRTRACSSSVSHFALVNFEFSQSITKEREREREAGSTAQRNRYFWLIDESFDGTANRSHQLAPAMGGVAPIYGTRCGTI